MQKQRFATQHQFRDCSQMLQQNTVTELLQVRTWLFNNDVTKVVSVFIDTIFHSFLSVFSCAGNKGGNELKARRAGWGSVLANFAWFSQVVIFFLFERCVGRLFLSWEEGQSGMSWWSDVKCTTHLRQELTNRLCNLHLHNVFMQ